VHDQLVDLHKGCRVQQHVNTLARGELALPVVAFLASGSARLFRQAFRSFEPFEKRSPVHGLSLL